MSFSEERLYELAERYHHIIKSIEDLRKDAGPVSFYGLETYRVKLHDKIAELADIDRVDIKDITSCADEYETKDDFYIALSDRIAKLKGA